MTTDAKSKATATAVALVVAFGKAVQNDPRKGPNNPFRVLEKGISDAILAAAEAATHWEGDNSVYINELRQWAENVLERREQPAWDIDQLAAHVDIALNQLQVERGRMNKLVDAAQDVVPAINNSEDLYNNKRDAFKAALDACRTKA